MKKQYLLAAFIVAYSAMVVFNISRGGDFGLIAGQFSIVLGAVLAYITIIFVIAQSLRRLDIVDIAWGGGFIVAALTSFFLQADFGWNAQTLVTTLVLVWGVRLGYYILRRVLRSTGEDPRYTDMRKTWKGNTAVNAYLRIFLTQGLLATIISIPVIHINLSENTPIGAIAVVGLVVWLIGFFFESVGDAQLKNHLGNPENKGRLMTSGLWKFTRHPNYFGEATQWWGVFIICLSVPFGIDGIIGPVVITYLLLFVSGVPLTEQRFEGRPGWSEYKKRTSKFFPLPPRS